jgi:hypothetical protein
MVFNLLNYVKKSQVFLILLLPMITLFPSTLRESFANEKPVLRDELDLREEIADVHFQIARGHDALGNVKKDAALGAISGEAPVNPGDQLDAAGDLKFWAFEEYQNATKQWEKIAKSIPAGRQLIRAKAARDNAETAWDACKRALTEAVELHRRAQEYFETGNNLDRKTAVLSKLARNLERLVDLKR